MKKFLIITKNHPIEAVDVMGKLYQAIGVADNSVFIGSPHFTALQTEKIKQIPFLQGFYPALRAYKKIEQFATEDIRTIIVVGTIDIQDALDYDVIVGYESPDIKEYTDFPQEFNTTNMKMMELCHSDIIFTKIEELIHFLRILLRREDAIDEQVQ